MKILRRGNLPENMPYQAACHKCTTLFEFERGEAQFVPDQRDGDALKIACPVCSEVCWVAV